MRGKIFRTDEANHMLPLVRRIADDIVATYGEVSRTLENFEAAKARTDTPEGQGPEHAALLRRLDGEVSTLLDRFQGLVEEIEALGGTVKDYERGCIDFYGDLDGEIVYLCWVRGEETVSHWHRLEEGFANRQSIAATVAA